MGGKLRQMRITLTTTPTHTQESSRVAGRMNLVSQEKAQMMLKEAGMLHAFWVEGFYHDDYLHKKTVSGGIGYRTHMRDFISALREMIA